MPGKSIHQSTIMVTIVVMFAFSTTGCKKILNVDPPASNVNEENVYRTDATATAVLTGIYAMISNGMSASSFTGSGAVSVLSGLSADELTLFSGVIDNRLIAYYRNALTASSPLNNYGSDIWAGSANSSALYSHIFICNAAIEGLAKSTTLIPAVKQQLLGEAKFMRAFFYFYLVNCFGDVPLALSTDPAINATISRSSKQDVYHQIVSDLGDAESLLSTAFLDGTLSPYGSSPERVRPTKWAAAALLARVYLYTGDFAQAESKASVVINQSSLFGLASLSSVFLTNSTEAIWQLQPVNAGRNTEDAYTFVIPATGPNNSANPVFLSSQLLNSFESGDQRKTNWISSVTPGSGSFTYYFAYKYKATSASGPATEYLMVMRLGELYLIRAEARAQQNNIGGAQADINMIRSRAGLPNITAATKDLLIAATLHERRVELFTELGHRWFDLKRTNTADAVMAAVTPLKGGTWQSTDQLYPLPFADIVKNPNLLQNPGY